MGEEKPKSAGVWPTVKPFVNGGASGMLATCVIQPIDMIKVRIQLGQGSATEVTRNMLKNDGIGAFYKGLSAGLLRQATYTTARLGSFKALTRKVEACNNRIPLTLYQEACCGLSSGAIAAFCSVPMLLAQSRVKAGGNHVSILQDLYRKCADEGVLALWKGGRHHANAVILMSAGMLTPYNRCFNYFRESHGFSEDRSTVGAGLVSGFFASACSIPYMHVYSTMKNMQPGANGKYPYSSFPDCAIKILKSRGPRAFFIGKSQYFRQTTSAALVLPLPLSLVSTNK